MKTDKNSVSAHFVPRLTEILGPRGIITDVSDMAPYLVDERGSFVGKAIAIARPSSTEEVAAVVRLCAEAGIPMVPQGGNTGLCGAATPFEHGGELLVSLTRMNKVRDIDPLNYAITVDAGVILADVQKAADDADRLFPLSLGGEGTALIGGNISTNAGGTGVLRYGPARDLVLGLEVVLPDGQIWDGLTALRKDNTGYDLKHLFIGAEGTLGIVTAVTLKLFPKPRQVESAFLAVPNPQAAVELLSQARESTGDRVITFELIQRLPLEFALRHFPEIRDPLADTYDYYVFFEIASSQVGNDLRPVLESTLTDAIEAGLVLDGVIAESVAQAADFWRIRDSLSEAQKYEGASIKHDISVPVSRVADFMEQASEIVREAVPGIRICAFGHVGDGNMHFNIAQPEGADGAAFKARQEEINRLVHNVVVSMGGSISAEHGIGRLRKEELAHYGSEIGLDLMRRIKSALDPDDLMNPGKVI
jgi:D-lactate dehydrogenase (cytochrome)